jgi:hypothetical protein
MSTTTNRTDIPVRMNQSSITPLSIGNPLKIYYLFPALAGKKDALYNLGQP